MRFSAQSSSASRARACRSGADSRTEFLPSAPPARQSGVKNRTRSVSTWSLASRADLEGMDAVRLRHPGVAADIEVDDAFRTRQLGDQNACLRHRRRIGPTLGRASHDAAGCRSCTRRREGVHRARSGGPRRAVVEHRLRRRAYRPVRIDRRVGKHLRRDKIAAGCR